MKNHSRRKFIKQTFIGAAGLASLPLLQSCKVAPSDTIRIGIIGLGQQAMNLMRGFARVPGVEILAGADVYGIKRERFKLHLDKFYKERDEDVDVKVYTDYREILERNDVDAVVIATPDHWHAIIAIAACKAGKDIYLEKPLTFSIKESLELVKAVRENDVILAVGSQQRSDANFRHAVQMVQSEAIGKLEKVSASVGPVPTPYDLPEEPIPADLDWEQWLGPMPFVHYNSRLNPPVSIDPPKNEKYWAEWRYFKETGGGYTCDWGAHNFDIGQWALGKDRGGPVTIIPAGYDDTEAMTFVYDNGVTMVNETFNKEKDKGVKFWGADGWIEVKRGGYLASDDSLLPGAGDDANKGLLYESGTSHLVNFIDCIRSRVDPVAPVESGQRTVATCILGNIAAELGRPVEWDAEKQYFVNDPEAEKFFHRQYREGYTL
jgi:predicted dehydrogenase